MNNAANVGELFGWLVASCKIETPVYAPTVKVAADAGTDIRNSPISGKGLFATRSAAPGDVLVSGYMQKQTTDDPRVRWEQSESCRYTNHANNPNAFVRKIGDHTDLIADEPIQPNEEITVNYKDATRTLGNGFFYTYRGKPYGNGIDAEEFSKKAVASRPATFYGLPTFRQPAETGGELAMDIAGFTRPAAWLTKMAISQLNSGLLGAGIGGLVGGVTDWIDSDPYARDPDTVWDGIIGGAVTGGLTGAVGHKLYHAINNFSPFDPKERKDAPPGVKSKSLSSTFKPGYKDKAIANATAYRKKLQDQKDPMTFLENIDPKVLDRKVQMEELSDADFAKRVSELGGSIGADAFYNPGDDKFVKRKSDDSLLDPHELTHAAQKFPMPWTREFQDRPEHTEAVKKIIERDNSPVYARSPRTIEETANYLTFKPEEEAYGADINRRYFNDTGKFVTDEASARDAVRHAQTRQLKPGEKSLPLYESLLRTPPEMETTVEPGGWFSGPKRTQKPKRDFDMEQWIDGLIKMLPGLVKNKSHDSKTKAAGEK